MRRPHPPMSVFEVCMDVRNPLHAAELPLPDVGGLVKCDDPAIPKLHIGFEVHQQDNKDNSKRDGTEPLPLSPRWRQGRLAGILGRRIDRRCRCPTGQVMPGSRGRDGAGSRRGPVSVQEASRQAHRSGFSSAQPAGRRGSPGRRSGLPRLTHAGAIAARLPRSGRGSHPRLRATTSRRVRNGSANGVRYHHRTRCAARSGRGTMPGGGVGGPYTSGNSPAARGRHRPGIGLDFLFVTRGYFVTRPLHGAAVVRQRGRKARRAGRG
jgi:hypothetical protein